MDIVVPLTLEAVRLVSQVCPGKSEPTPEYIYDLFYEELSHTYIYIFSDGGYFFASESDLKGLVYVPVTVEEAREILFIDSLAQ